MKVCVVGAGNAGCAHAAVLARNGCDVSLLKTSTGVWDENFAAISARGGIVLRDLDGSETFVGLRTATRDPGEALRDPVDILLVLTQTTCHERVAELLAGVDFRAEMALVVPGYLGSVYFWRALRDRVSIFAEGESPAYDARLEEPGAVRVCFKNVRNALGFLTTSKKDAGLELARELVDTYRYARANAVDSALRNPNLILHTIGCVTSSARIELSRGEFWMYREGFTPSIWNLVERLDAEKQIILDEIGADPTSYLQDCQFRNEIELGGDPMDAFRHYAAEGGPKGPSSLHSRYLLEDVPNGLGLLCSIGDALGTPTQIARALIAISGALLGKNFYGEERTLRSLGFDSFGELWRLFEEL